MLTKELDKNLRVCMNCGYHLQMNAKQRIKSLLDDGSFEEFNQDMMSENPLEFPGYPMLPILKDESITATTAGDPSTVPFPVTTASFSDVFSRSFCSFSRYPGR